MTKYKVVVSDQVFPSVEVERGLLADIDAELVVASGDVESVLATAADADAILNTYLPWSADSIARLTRCKIIARYGIGFDNVDLKAAADAGVAGVAAGPGAVLAYLSRYTHRVAISNGRLIGLDERGVTFRWKDYRAKGRTRYKAMTLDAREFMRSHRDAFRELAK